jgi:hypothetical protein
MLQVQEFVRKEYGIGVAHVPQVHLHQAAQACDELLLCHRLLLVM